MRWRDRKNRDKRRKEFKGRTRKSASAPVSQTLVVGSPSHRKDLLISICFSFTDTKSPDAIAQLNAKLLEAWHEWHIWSVVPGETLKPPACYSCPYPCWVHARGDRGPCVMGFFLFGCFFVFFHVVLLRILHDFQWLWKSQAIGKTLPGRCFILGGRKWR